jgi:predicted lipoprotein with Yx(FWY)xxD motif
MYGSSVKANPSSKVAGAARVGSASSSLGRIVVGGGSRTLYLFEKDNGRQSACYGQCAKFWPPVLTQSKPMAGAGANESLLGLTHRTDGTQQVTYAGHPLYRFVGDMMPGQTNGEGSREFGGGWDALSPTGRKIEAGD